jgi:hypothetical protein
LSFLPCHAIEGVVPTRIVLEEFHLTATVAPSTRGAVSETARRALNGRRFQAALRAAIRKIRNRFPALKLVRLTLAR